MHQPWYRDHRDLDDRHRGHHLIHLDRQLHHRDRRQSRHRHRRHPDEVRSRRHHHRRDDHRRHPDVHQVHRDHLDVGRDRDDRCVNRASFPGWDEVHLEHHRQGAVDVEHLELNSDDRHDLGDRHCDQ
jgi:hypothetical protein